MEVETQIENYISSQPEPKRGDMLDLHRIILELMPGRRLWFLDGKDSNNKLVSNPNVGYGRYSIRYSDGTSRDFYKIGMSANTTGISIYIMGIKDKTYLAKTYANELGKATITGYCVKFKALKDINIEVLKSAIRDGVDQ